MNETVNLNLSTQSSIFSVTNEDSVVPPGTLILPITYPVVQQPRWTSPSMEIQKLVYHKNEQDNLVTSDTKLENIPHSLNNGQPMAPATEEESSESLCYKCAAVCLCCLGPCLQILVISLL
ncbi:uncharacterized protein LOC126884228 [Diabrotica virgifera virgifera]|uniref:Cysteine-rich transmembrane CYSTM domain-containing protein n=1 Tax=Diabrotica virgifera virgifera TaxID=50390 RepID=A0ABM5K7B0_DIAVI|nr:uncharacterized protein LOC126884228 [Diabrotica virgifera virgifera]